MNLGNNTVKTAVKIRKGVMIINNFVNGKEKKKKKIDVVALLKKDLKLGELFVIIVAVM